MSAELAHPLQSRGRGLPNRAPDAFHTVKLVVHKMGDDSCLVALVVTDGGGHSTKDTRLGECWIRRCDETGTPHRPYRLLQLALEKLLAQPGARFLPDSREPRA